MRRRSIRVLLLTLRPLRFTDSIPDVLKLAPGPVVAVLLSIYGAWQHWPASWHLSAVLSVFLILALWAAYRLMAEQDNQHIRKPLRVESVVADETSPKWRRLVVSNDNDFPVEDAYVQIVTMKPPVRPRGWRFSWTTHGGTHVARAVNIGPGSERIVDIVQFQIVGGRGETAALLFQPSKKTDEYDLAVSAAFDEDGEIHVVVASDKTAIPPARYRIVVSPWSETVTIQKSGIQTLAGQP